MAGESVMTSLRVRAPQIALCLIAAITILAASCFVRRPYYLRDNPSINGVEPGNGQFKPAGYLNDPSPKGVISGLTPGGNPSTNGPPSNELYSGIVENEFVAVASRPL